MGYPPCRKKYRPWVILEEQQHKNIVEHDTTNKGVAERGFMGLTLPRNFGEPIFWADKRE